MHNNIYQEYMNNIIGTVPLQNKFEDSINIHQAKTSNDINVDIERFYPELYRVLYPMIQSACMKNTRPITEETINEMTKDIYSNFNADDVTTLNINLTNNVRSKINESQVSGAKKEAETRNTAKEELIFRSNNYVLKDLIRILLIRELLGRPGFPIRRPLYRESSQIPEFFRYYNKSSDIYENMNWY